MSDPSSTHRGAHYMIVFLLLTWIANFLRAVSFLFCHDTASSLRMSGHLLVEPTFFVPVEVFHVPCPFFFCVLGDMTVYMLLVCTTVA